MKTRPDRRLEYLPPGDIQASTDNPRRHPPQQIRKIAKSMKAFGVVAPVIVDRQGKLIAGHARRAAALLAGIARIPVIRADDLTDAQARAYMLADNKLAEGATWDEALVAAHLKGLTQMALDFEIGDIGFAPAEIDALTLDLDAKADDDDADSFAIADGPPVSRNGDLWLLGDHKIHCGSALDPAAYEALLVDEKASAVFTGPPYNVPIKGHVSGKGKVVHREFPQASGEMSSSQFTEFLTTAFSHARHATVKGALVYGFMDHRHLEEMLAATESAGLKRVNVCVWVKTNAGMGSHYRSQHEFCFVLRNPGAPHLNNIQLGRFGRNRSNVWNYPGANILPCRGEEDLLAMHPTAKPIVLVADVILDATRQGDIVLDPFLGSGTTVLAAERTKRRGFGIEKDPAYVDTAIARWEALTGQQAKLSSGEPFAVVKTERNGS